MLRADEDCIASLIFFCKGTRECMYSSPDALATNALADGEWTISLARRFHSGVGKNLELNDTYLCSVRHLLLLLTRDCCWPFLSNSKEALINYFLPNWSCKYAEQIDHSPFCVPWFTTDAADGKICRRAMTQCISDHLLWRENENIFFFVNFGSTRKLRSNISSSIRNICGSRFSFSFSGQA